VRKMRIPRVAAAGLLAVAAVTLSACGSQSPDIAPPPSQAAPPASGAATNGITTASQVFGPGCGQLPQGGEPGSAQTMSGEKVAAAIASNPQLSRLTQAIQKSGVTGELNEAPSATVFAPYDAAFAAMQQNDANQYNALMANAGQLADTAKYHVSVHRYTKDSLLAAGTVTTLQGASLTVKPDGDSLTLSDNTGQVAHVLCGNIPTANATVFIIDKVLSPKEPSSN
jgi:uncharacterized surface protein with fasciclin (FAS1) repeats